MTNTALSKFWVSPQNRKRKNSVLRPKKNLPPTQRDKTLLGVTPQTPDKGVPEAVTVPTKGCPSSTPKKGHAGSEKIPAFTKKPRHLSGNKGEISEGETYRGNTGSPKFPKKREKMKSYQKIKEIRTWFLLLRALKFYCRREGTPEALAKSCEGQRTIYKLIKKPQR